MLVPPPRSYEALLEIRQSIANKERQQLLAECERLRRKLINAGVSPVVPAGAPLQHRQKQGGDQGLILVDSYEHHAPIGSLAVCSESGAVAACLWDGSVSIVEPMQRCCEITNFRAEGCRAVVASTFVRGAQNILGLATAQEAQIWWWSEDECTHQASVGHGAQITAMDSHARVPLLATVGDDGQVNLWDVERHSCFKTLNRGGTGAGARNGVAELTGCRFLSSGTEDRFGGYNIATTGLDGVLNVWDIREAKVLRSLNGAVGTGAAVCVDFHSSSYATAVGYSGGTIGVYDVRNWNLLRNIEVGGGNDYCAESARADTIPVMPRSLAFSPCGLQLAIGGADGEICLVGVQRRYRSALVHKHEDTVIAMSWGCAGQQPPRRPSDSTFLACASLDGTWSCFAPHEPGAFGGLPWFGFGLEEEGVR